MKLDGDAGRLRKFAAFDRFSDRDLQRLVGAAQRSSASKPRPLIHEQTASDACYILLSGEVGVYVGMDRIAVLGPGELIGESVLRGKLRSATVTTTGPAELLRIDRDDLPYLLDQIPALRDAMEATANQHVPVPRPAKPKPERSTVNASVPTDLVERFERVAGTAGVSVATALANALTEWMERNGTA